MVDLIEKIAPHAVEAEMAVLGAMLIEAEAQARAFEMLDQKCFYKTAHQDIFRSMADLFNKSSVIDVITVAEDLKNRRILTDIGGASYLTGLTHTLPTAASLEHYARIVKEKAVLRQLIAAATRIVTSCYEQQDNTASLLDQAEQTIFSIAQSKTEKGFAPISELVHSTIDVIQKLAQNKAFVTGVSTGFKELDSLTTGLQPSNMVILAARPGMGKTSFALNILEHVAVDEKRPVALFSLEMSQQELMMRLLCSRARADSQKVRRGYMAREYWTPLTACASQIAESPIYIDDSSSISVLDIRARVRRLAAELAAKNTPLAMIIVDYLQLMRGTNRVENRQQEISEISRSLKGLARDMNVPVVALSQLSRRPEERGREGGRPVLSDLRESGAIEQDADVVVFLYQEAKANKLEDLGSENIVKVAIAKQRNGPTGDFELAFLRQYTRFENLDRRAAAEA